MAGTQDKPVALGELRYGSMSEAKEKFQGAVQLFTKNLSDNPDLGAVHGYFGHLSGEEWLAFHVKRNEDIQDSKKELAKTFSRYLAYCDEHPEAVHPHYQLGNISVDQWRQVHVKHVQHHMRQFGMDV